MITAHEVSVAFDYIVKERSVKIFVAEKSNKLREDFDRFEYRFNTPFFE